MVTCWDRADLLTLVCGVHLCDGHFPIGILGQVWYLIVSIPDLCTLTYFFGIGFLFCRVLLGVIPSLAIILLRTRELA